jgi:hypothetical protein
MALKFSSPRYLRLQKHEPGRSKDEKNTEVDGSMLCLRDMIKNEYWAKTGDSANASHADSSWLFYGTVYRLLLMIYPSQQ